MSEGSAISLWTESFKPRCEEQPYNDSNSLYSMQKTNQNCWCLGSMMQSSVGSVTNTQDSLNVQDQASIFNRK